MRSLIDFAFDVLGNIGLGGQALETVGRKAFRSVGILPGENGEGRPRRRRRRPMFTSTDLAQFAAVEGIAGKAAVRSLMLVRAAKA